jgi:hypothetical protein
MTSARWRDSVVVLIAAYRVGMPDNQDIGHRPLRDLCKYRLESRFGLFRQFVLALDELDGEPVGRVGCAASAGPKSS